MTTLHEARIERAARLVAEAEVARAEAWELANAADEVLFSARDASADAHHAAWAADVVLNAARAAQAKANGEGSP